MHPPPLFGSFAENCFQGGVEIAPHLCHALIANSQILLLRTAGPYRWVKGDLLVMSA